MASFQEWLKDRDPELVSEIDWNSVKTLGKGALGAGILGAGILGGSHLGSKFLSGGGGSTPPATPAAMSYTMPAQSQTRGYLPPPPEKQIPDKSVTVDDTSKGDTSYKPGRTFRMKGGFSNFADVRATVQRPNPNQWVFTIKGEIEPRLAIKQAKAIVQDELGARTPANLSAEFDPTDDGMVVKINHAMR